MAYGQELVPTVLSPDYFDVSIPLRDIPVEPTFKKDTLVRNPMMRIRNHPFAETALPKGPDEAWQQEMGTQGDERGAPTINFEGISNINGSIPPDTQGDVGPNHYFQVVNSSYQIFDKQGNSLLGPLNTTSIWSGFTISSITDPIVLYDSQADRWFISVFKSTSPYSIYIAVSTTGDPTGSWYRWSYTWATKPDYPKYGVWRDGYYMGCNTSGQDVAVFDRSSMIAGNASPQAVTFDNSNRPNIGFHAIMPLDNDGAFAPSGSPGLFITINDDAWGGSDQLWIYSLSVNWSNPSAASFNRIQQLNVTAFDSNFGTSWDNIAQPDVAQELDAVPEVLMFRAQYLNFGTHQAIVCTHSVDVNNTDRAGVRWYELRKTGANWFIHQQSTYSPSADSRWMGSIAMNSEGDIALGYSVSSSSVYPSIRYTGRKASDPVNTMTMTERSIFAGANSQTGFNRWGDYSMMSVDPSDDTRFWYTNEYSNGGASWRTRVAAFSFSSSCYASGGCTEYISRVEAGSIDNSTGCTNYGDYTLSHSTNLPMNAGLLVKVTNGAPFYTGDQCGIWVDWNRDGDFYDANESITVSGTPGVGPYTAAVYPPVGTTTGQVVMRIRITWTGAVDPCGSTSFGEVEDYKINLTGNTSTNYWTGIESTSWHDPKNWSLLVVPTSALHAIIPSGTPFSPEINSAAQCNNLTLQAGAILTHNNSFLDVYGTFDAGFGQYTMTSTSAWLYFFGSTNTFWWDDNQNDTYTNVRIWKSDNAVVTQQNNITCSGTLNVISGQFQLALNRSLTINSTSSLALEVSGGATLRLSAGKTITTAGGIQFSSGSIADISGGTFNCGGNFRVNNNVPYDIDLSAANLVMNGTSTQYIQDFDDGNLKLGNLTINKSAGKVYISNANLKILGNLVISSGVLSCYNAPTPTSSYNITVAGNWTNSNFPSGFEPGNGKVTFNGAAHNLINTNENFNILEANMGAALRIQYVGQIVTCNQYLWSSGGIDVYPGGTFTALDLAQQGLTGGFWVNPGSVINLYQDNVQWIDLDGDLYFNGGGTINVYGGNGDSWWAFSKNASLTMNGGTLDFKNNGIRIQSSSYTLGVNITGNALIRTAGGLSATRTGFAPAGGTFEFYGSSDRFINFGAENSIANVVVNKSSKGESGATYNGPVYDPRSKELVTEGTRANMLSLSSNISLTGNLTIMSGNLNAGFRTINISGDWTNNVGTSGFNEGTSTVIFNGPNPAKINTEETFYNFTLDKTYSGWECMEIMSVPITILNNLTILDGNLEVNSNSVLTIGNNVTIANGGGLNVGFLDNNVQVFVGGNWTNNNTLYDTFIGYSTSGDEVITFNGSADQIVTTAAPFEDFGTFVINKPAGAVRPNGNLQILGDFEIISGNFTSNALGLTHNFLGDFTIHGSGNYFPGSPSTTAFKGSSNQVYQNFGGSGVFNNVVVDKNDAKSTSFIETDNSEPYALVETGKIPTSLMLTLLSDVVAFNGGTTTINHGALNLGGKLYKSMGAININDGGIIYLPESSRLSVVSSLSVNSGGLLECKGTSTSNARIYKDVVGFYAFEVKSGGTISAEHTIFEHMAGPDGINIRNGALIDPGYTFNHCTFRNGDGSTSSALLAIYNNQVMTVTGASFPNSTATYNVAKDINHGMVTFVDFFGSFAGETFDFDPFNRVNWFVPELSASPLVHNVNPLAGSVNFNITSNLAWTIAESVAWFSVTPMSGSNNATITINYTQNSSPTPRSGIITISAPGVPNVTVTVNQSGASLTVTPATQNVTAAAGSTSFSVASNTSWTVTESVAWLSVLPMSGTGNGTLNVSYNQNSSTTPRSGQITVSSPGLTNVVVTVNQAGIAATLTVTPANRDVAATAGSTTFSLNSNTGWAVSESVPWLSVTPMSGTGNGTLTVNYGENASGSTRVGTINVTATGGSPSVNVTVTQVSYPTHSVSLNAGWQGLSSYIMPANNAIVDVFAPVSPNFIIAQTMTGVYYPAGPVNTIVDWLSQSAYKVKMSSAATLPVIGNEETNKVFLLSAGWNLVPVIVNAPLNPVTLFSGTSLTIAKDVAGTGVYWPAYGINTLGNLLPGRAYYALLGTAGSITFPANSKAEWTGIYPEFQLPDNPWNDITVSPSSHLIAIESSGMAGLMHGDMIGIFGNEGVCYGVTEITSVNANALLTAYSNDELTGSKDGFDAMEPMLFKVYRSSTGETFDVVVEYDVQLPQTSYFVGEGLSAIKTLKLSATGISGELASGISIYPNPTDGTVQISGISEFTQIDVVGTLGAFIQTIQTGGESSVNIDLSGLKPGIYQIRLSGEKGTVVKRVVRK